MREKFGSWPQGRPVCARNVASMDTLETSVARLSTFLLKVLPALLLVASQAGLMLLRVV